MQQMKDELLFDKAKNEFDRLELKCKIMIETELNYNLIEVEKSKIDYLEGIIFSLLIIWQILIILIYGENSAILY